MRGAQSGRRESAAASTGTVASPISGIPRLPAATLTIRCGDCAGGDGEAMIVLNIVFVLLAIGVIYGAFVVPVYNFATRPVKAGRDVFIVVFSVIFTVAILQILWSIHGDLHRWLG